MLPALSMLSNMIMDAGGRSVQRSRRKATVQRELQEINKGRGQEAILGRGQLFALAQSNGPRYGSYHRHHAPATARYTSLISCAHRFQRFVALLLSSNSNSTSCASVPCFTAAGPASLWLLTRLSHLSHLFSRNSHVLFSRARELATVVPPPGTCVGRPIVALDPLARRLVAQASSSSVLPAARSARRCNAPGRGAAFGFALACALQVCFS